MKVWGRARNWVLVAIGAAAASLVHQIMKAQGVELAGWMAGGLVVVLAISVWDRVCSIAEIRRLSAATSDVMLKTSEHVADVHKQVAEANETIAGMGVRLKEMHEQQLHLGAQLRARHPGDGSQLAGWLTDIEPPPDESREYAAYGRALMKTMQSREHKRPDSDDLLAQLTYEQLDEYLRLQEKREREAQERARKSDDDGSEPSPPSVP